MKIIIGLLLIVAGIALGLYVGLWLMFIGGIVSIIEQIRAEHLDALTVAWGVVRILFAGLVGMLAAIVLIIPGGRIISTYHYN